MADILDSLGLSDTLNSLGLGDISALAGGDLSALTGGLGLGDLGGLDIAAVASGDLSSLDLGAILGGLTGQPAKVSQCKESDFATPELYQKCKDDEDKAAAEEALRKKEEDDQKFKDEYANREKINDLECTMDGFVDLALKFMENLLLIISLLKELLALALEGEPDLFQSLQLIWNGMIGGSSWFGYALYILYGVGLDYDFGTTYCEVISYLYYVVDGMNYIVAFAKPAEDAPAEEEATEEEKLAAAKLAMENANANADANADANAEANSDGASAEANADANAEANADPNADPNAAPPANEETN